MKIYTVYTTDGPKYIKAEEFSFTVDTLKLTKMGDDKEQVSVAVFLKEKVTGVVDSDSIYGAT